MTGHFSGSRGGFEADGGVVCGRGGRIIRNVRLTLSRGGGAKVGQWQVDSSHIVNPQQDLQGADLLKTLIYQSLACPLNLLNARREGADSTSWRGRERKRERDRKLEDELTGLMLCPQLICQ